MDKEKSLNELYELRNKLEEFLILARALGRIKLGDEIITYAELKEEMNNIKAEIASQISNSRPYILK